MTSKHIPVPNSTLPFWRTDPHPLDNYRSTETLPEKSDVVIIGAGYAGASVAHHILRNVKNGAKAPSITILEARQACSGATARNGGHMKPDIYNFIATLAEDYGVDAAAEVAAFEAKHVHVMKDFVEAEKINCDYTVTKAVDVQLTESHFKKLKDGYHRLVAGGSKATDAQIIESEEAETFSGVKGAVGCFAYDAGHIWAYKFVLHILENAVSQGINLQTHTPVSKVSESTHSDSPYRWRVETSSRSAVAAKVVVFATNAYTSTLAPQYQGKIVPVRGTCSRIVVPPGSQAPRLTNTYTLRLNAWDYDYLIPRGDGSIVVGGARSSFIHDEKNWLDVSDDSRVLEPAARYFDGYMQRNFVGWENSHAYTDRVWTGIMGYSADGLPHVGQVPGQEGQFILAGFTGHGMPQIFLVAEAIAKMVVNGASFEETKLPRLFKTNQERITTSKSNISDKAPPATAQAKL